MLATLNIIYSVTHLNKYIHAIHSKLQYKKKKTLGILYHIITAIYYKLYYIKALRVVQTFCQIK